MGKLVKTAALIVAAGSGNRCGGDLPKQYQKLGQHSVLARTVKAFTDHPHISDVVIVISSDHVELYESLKLSIPYVIGGESRQQSVRLGLEALHAHNPSHVLIHDAARPFISRPVIDDILRALENKKSVLAAVKVVDTIKRCADGYSESTINRENLWRAQTPQAFCFQDIYNLHQTFADQPVTDDTSLAELGGLKAFIVPSDEDNFKITTIEDLQRARNMINQAKETRTGMGFDVHAFTDGDHVTLCGVKIPHTHALAGHSDADVAMHALTDAILGSCGGGDIGQHFPPSEEKWKGAKSEIFLSHAMSLLKEKGGHLVHADVTIICQAPKIAPYCQAMITELSRICGVSEDRINIKATTTEQLGFTGRKEGIAAQAIATVRLPCQD